MTRGHLIAYEGQIIVKTLLLVLGVLFVVLPEIVFRWLSYSIILVANNQIGIIIISLLVIIFFFQAAITGKDVKTIVFFIFKPLYVL